MFYLVENFIPRHKTFRVEIKLSQTKTEALEVGSESSSEPVFSRQQIPLQKRILVLEEYDAFRKSMNDRKGV